MIADSRTVLTALRQRGGLCIDPLFPGECRQIFGNRGFRRHYLRSSGMTIDQFTEFLFDRGFTVTRIDTVAAFNILDQLFTAAPAKRARTRIDVPTIERDAKRAKTNRNKKFSCPECGRTRCNGAVSTCDVICGPCYRSTGNVVFLQRCELTFTEVMTQYASGAAEAAPF
jgi:hypothetical protein